MEKIPFVSSLVQSKLAIRAVEKGDMTLLRELREDREKVHSLRVNKSVFVPMSALDFAFKNNNLEAARIILAKDEEDAEPRVEQPTCRLHLVQIYLTLFVLF